MVGLNPNISVIIANITELNTLEDKGCSTQLKKNSPVCMLFIRDIPCTRTGLQKHSKQKGITSIF